MAKILISPAHYLLDYTSRSEFYFVGKLIYDLATSHPENEYLVLCGRCANPMPSNVKIVELLKKGDSMELNLYSRISFYVKILVQSIRISFANKIDVVWHLFPNGRFSFNPFIFFQLDRLLSRSVKRVIGRLQYAKHDIHHKLDKFHLNSLNMHTIQPDRITAVLQKRLFKILGYFSNYYFNLFDMLIFNNQSARTHYLRHTISHIKHKDVIIPVAIDTTQFPFHEKQLGQKLELLYAGVLDKNKRVDQVIRICHALQSKNVAFHLSIAGDGEMRHELEVLAKDLLKEGSYTFFGNVPKKDMGEFHKKAHFLFSLSLSESFGQVFAESWSSGTVFIGSTIPVYAEVIRHGENGLLYDVENGRPEEMATTLSEMSEENYKRIAKQAHEEVKVYDWSAVVNQYAETLEQLHSAN